MKTLRLSALIGLAALSVLTGCGGGGGGGASDELRSLLTGGSIKEWRVSQIDANATNYFGTDSDPETFVACPASFSARGGGSAWACIDGDFILFSEDGTVLFDVGLGSLGGSGTWSLSGSTLTMDFGDRGTTTDTVTVINPGRVVLRRVRSEVGGVVQTTEAQNAYVIVPE